VLGNLPYYVSSQILFAYTAEPSPVRTLVFTLQKELAERLSAKPRTKAYGALTLLIGRQWRVKYLRTLPGSVFTPAPTIESGVVLFSPRPPDEMPACDGPRFTTLVKQGFSQPPQTASQNARELRARLAGPLRPPGRARDVPRRGTLARTMDRPDQFRHGLNRRRRRLRTPRMSTGRFSTWWMPTIA